ncbi:restriction endonuclease subunit S [Hymenobacter frigidus]|uniref:Restriction endonuclease subunit S n=1 Tax=Hymenobacter frigidus TaxID=1524095 RepID=A0ABQ1ZW66_9BACT|nr:restriction endonuclease subunit S [Hymenobacter frigidus]GGH80879.1 restriction endonuclease subunit S [Hymenobacter frigidus]
MSKKAHETALPKRRFPEFQGKEPWEVKPLGSVAKLIKEKAGSKQYKLMSITSGAGLVSQMEKFGREIAGASYKNYYVIRKGDFAYNKSSTKLDPEGQIALLENEEAGAVPNSIFTCFRVNEQIVSPQFLKYPFANNIHGKWLRDLIIVGARVNGALSIDSKHLLALPLALPSLPEQQKIATALSSLDALLTAQTDKLTALQAHKRSLMQNLFPAEGETVPKRRFSEFQDAVEWNNCPLKEVFTIFQGFAFSSRDSALTGARWLKIADVGIQKMNPDAPSFLPSTHKEKYKRYLVREGDYVMALTRPLLGNELKISPVNNFFDGALLNQRVGKLETENNNTFVYYLLQTSRLIAKIKKNIAGTEPPNLSAQHLDDIEVSIPERAEQQKIADSLSSLDNIITAQSRKIDALKLHKKGLMQVLFPSLKAND